ncbi:CheR-type MCP methyltransferase [Thiogranum longum]|uniref:protein-glutamate O-methyltransferase n=1 Tax=Thiogranum longum TaxID=1537524 RepID=A0A4V2PGK2_9GAMM|nr:protein-glutamate O-methyltransferase CheR [Thiogranum longum]TCK17146.1 CheR-type MCP methyltransferase [Thiogranum longum]
MSDPAGQSGAVCEPRQQAGCSQHIDDRQFARWTRLLEGRAGLFIAPERKSFLASGLRARMRETGCEDLAEYYQLLSSPAMQAREWPLLVDQLTVHETCFFRHAPSMRLVEKVVLPEHSASMTTFNAWSVACSTGEEAYSLAMLIDHFYAGNSTARRFGVTGTDISLPALQQARTGAYMDRRLKDIPEDFRERYCTPVIQRRFEVEKELRERVCFAQLNLRDVASAPMADMDLVFCQNLLIYYDRERRLEIVNSLSDCLRPGGVLVLGPGELLNWQHPHMEKVRYQDTLAYRRTD